MFVLCLPTKEDFSCLIVRVNKIYIENKLPTLNWLFLNGL